VTDASTTGIGSGTAAGLLAFLDFLIEKGYATSAQVTPWKSAVRQVLSTLEGEDFGSVPILMIDADEYMTRFENLVMGRYKHESLASYRSRFRRAIEAYRAYLDDKALPERLSPRSRPTRERASRAADPPRAPNRPNASTEAADPERLIEYPFPLRSGTMARLLLPRRLEKADAERLGMFIRALALELQAELPAARTDRDQA
jgi:hypothetical protein